jgi:hypothetical protein
LRLFASGRYHRWVLEIAIQSMVQPLRSRRLVTLIGLMLVVSVASIADRSSRHDALTRVDGAARPFDWASGIGDFNTDGTPDVAIADRIANRHGRYAYRIDFAVSGQTEDGRDDVTFESTFGDVTLRVADVDRDNDLDVIVATPLAGESVGIWLNDGAGHFTAGVRPTSARIGSEASLDSADRELLTAAFEPLPRRAEGDLAVTVRAPLQTSKVGFVERLETSPPTQFLFSGTTPRAPPAPRG